MAMVHMVYWLPIQAGLRLKPVDGNIEAYIEIGLHSVNQTLASLTSICAAGALHIYKVSDSLTLYLHVRYFHPIRVEVKGHQRLRQLTQILL